MSDNMSDNDLLKSMLKPVEELNPPVITIVGEGGMGKTTLGATFDMPVFMRFEDGTSAIQSNEALASRIANIQQLPVIKNVGEEMDQLRLLGTTDHPFKTLVVDTISAMNILYENHVVATDSKRPKSINQACGGYGAGHGAVGEMHRNFRERCERLREVKGMTIVFLCHADIQDMELPDTDRYMKYTLRMNKKSLPHYTDDVDLVGHIRLLQHTFGEGDRKKISSNGVRTMTCFPIASSVSKNRFGITKDIGVNNGENPLIDYIPWLRKES